MTKNQTISANIIALTIKGYSVDAAVDAVLGAGTYAKIASDVWEEANVATKWTSESANRRVGGTFGT